MSKIKRGKNIVSVPSSLDYLKEVDEFVETRLKNAGLDENKLADVAISVAEAVTNAVVHGNKRDLRKRVKVALKIEDPRIIIEVQDQGNGFNPKNIDSPLEGNNVLKEAGRGIFILKSLMDEVDFSFGPEGGTVVRMVKYIKK
jgi:serine/threonine-protein kinase RsbW